MDLGENLRGRAERYSTRSTLAGPIEPARWAGRMAANAVRLTRIITMGNKM